MMRPAIFNHTLRRRIHSCHIMSVFERLSRQGTASSIQKQRHRKPAQAPACTPQPLPRRGKYIDISPQQQRTGVGGDGSNGLDRTCNIQQRSLTFDRSRPHKQDKSRPTLGSASITIQFRTNMEKKGGKPYSTLPLGALPEIRKAVHGFELGTLTERQLAYEMISQLFDRDFMPGRHWDIDSATVSEMSGTCPRTSQDIDEYVNFSKAQDMVWFVVEKQATWDHKDIYSVASARAIIKMSHQLRIVLVDEYSYYVAG